jgi:PAS domain S-box-containing protein
MAAFEMAPGKYFEELAGLRRKLSDAEAELERHRRKAHSSSEQFRLLADASPAMIWMAGPDALYYYFNPVWLEYRGRTLEEETGNRWTDGLHPDDRDLCLETYLKAFSARQRFHMQYRLRRASGDYSWVEAAGAPYFDVDGNFAGYIGTAADVTGRKRGFFTPDEESVRMVFNLTERERQVLVLIADGNSTKEAATRLGISYKTADSHRSRILEKLGVHETASMVRYAIRAGLIAP